MSRDLDQNTYISEGVLPEQQTRMWRAQIHECGRRHNATAGLASYEHFLLTQAQRIRLWTRSFSSIAGLALRNAYIGARPLVPFLLTASNDAIIPPPTSYAPSPPSPFFLFLRLVRALFHSRDVIAACIFYETSLRPCTHPSATSYPSIHPSMMDPSVRRRL